MGAGWDDDDYEEVDPEYGVFGDPGGLVPRLPRPVPELSPLEKALIKRRREREEADRRTSREFNSYMISLYNESRKP